MDLRVLLFVLFVLLCLCDDVVAVIDFLFIFLGGGSGGMELDADLFFFLHPGDLKGATICLLGKPAPIAYSIAVY